MILKRVAIFIASVPRDHHIRTWGYIPTPIPTLFFKLGHRREVRHAMHTH